MIAAIQFRKACACRSTGASGPRIVLGNWRRNLPMDAFVFTYQLVPMACDNCNTPWTMTVTTE